MRTQIAGLLSSAVLCSAVLCSAVLGLTALSPAAIAQSKAAKADRPVYLSVKEIMESIIDPSADALWGAVGTVLDNDGVHELAPSTPEQWVDLRHAAVRIIEGANLLMMPERDAAPAGAKSEAPGVELEGPQMTALIKKNRKAFDAFARSLQGVGMEALRASDSKDIALLMDMGAHMENVCESCHSTFWYPAEKRSRF